LITKNANERDIELRTNCPTGNFSKILKQKTNIIMFV